MPGGTTVPMPGIPMKFSDSATPEFGAPPTLGRDTRSVLGELLGYDAAQIDALRGGQRDPVAGPAARRGAAAASQPSAPAARHRSMPVRSTPASTSALSVCSPSRGAIGRTVPGSSANLIGMPRWR